MLALQYFKKYDARFPIVIGSSLDCILGGNIFYKSIKNVKSAVAQRYSEILKQNFGLLSEKYIERLSVELISATFMQVNQSISKMINQTFTGDLAIMLNSELKHLNDYVQAEYERIRKSGSLEPSLQIQRFILENRDRKMFFGQPLTIRRKNKIYIPSFEYCFLSKASAVHPSLRLHHKLYLSLYRKHLPDLLKIKNGAYGLKPVYLRLLLETSRFVLKKKEKALYRQLLKNKGDLDLSDFRSASVFEVCGRGNETIERFNELIERNSKVLNTDEMKNYTNKIRNYENRVFNYERLFRGLEICQVLNKNI